MSHGPCGLPDLAAEPSCDLQATINVAGSANTTASIITKLIFFFMVILFLSNWDFPFGSPPETARTTKEQDNPPSQWLEAES